MAETKPNSREGSISSHPSQDPACPRGRFGPGEPYREPAGPPPEPPPLPGEPSFLLVAGVIIVMALLIHAFQQPGASNSGVEQGPRSTWEQPPARGAHAGRRNDIDLRPHRDAPRGIPHVK
jgi:hypothetical protein